MGIRSSEAGTKTAFGVIKEYFKFQAVRMRPMNDAVCFSDTEKLDDRVLRLINMKETGSQLYGWEPVI